VSKVLLTTGGGRGICAATARLGAERGYAICVNYRQNRATAADVVRSIEDCGARAIAVAADVALEADVRHLFDTCDRTLGRLTALVNNAGILET
jgi:NAD(P)-dependent dehydrogenase (short-subunit alcohol dehydrogenase family)